MDPTQVLTRPALLHLWSAGFIGLILYAWIKLLSCTVALVMSIFSLFFCCSFAGKQSLRHLPRSEHQPWANLGVIRNNDVQPRLVFATRLFYELIKNDLVYQCAAKLDFVAFGQS